MSDLDWTAGFLEGEGCFFINRSKRAPSTPVVQASQVDPESIRKLQSLYGGSIQEDNRRRNGCLSPNIQYQWRLTGNRALELIKQLRPLMSARRQEQMDIVIEGVGERKMRNALGARLPAVKEAA